MGFDNETVSAVESPVILKYMEGFENVCNEDTQQWLVVDCMVSGCEVPTDKEIIQ